MQQGDFQRERKDEERAKGGEETWGEGKADGRDRGKLQYMRLIYYFQKESTRTLNLAQSKELRV